MTGYVIVIAEEAGYRQRRARMTRKMEVTITVEITVPEDADLEAREYAAYAAAREALNDNTADWDAIDVDEEKPR